MTRSLWYQTAPRSACPPLHISPRLEPLGTVQSYSRPRTAELRRSVPQDRFTLVESITPRSSGPTVLQRPRSPGQRTLPKDLQRETRPLSIAESNGQLRPCLVHAESPRQSNGMVAVITPRQSGVWFAPADPERKTVKCKSSQPNTVSHERPIH